MTSPTAGHARRRRLDGRPLRLALSAGLLAAAAAVITVSHRVRMAESRLVADVAGLLGLAVNTSHTRPEVFLTMPPPHHVPAPYWVALLVTNECTSTWLLAPLFVVAGLAVLGRRLSVRAIAVATAVTAALLVVVNVARLCLMLVATNRWGLAGYRWTHEVYGSLLTIAGVCCGIALFVKLVVALSRRDLRVGPG